MVRESVATFRRGGKENGDVYSHAARMLGWKSWNTSRMSDLLARTFQSDIVLEVDRVEKEFERHLLWQQDFRYRERCRQSFGPLHYHRLIHSASNAIFLTYARHGYHTIRLWSLVKILAPW